MASLTVGATLIPENITKKQFEAALKLYPSLIARISDEKKNAGKQMGQNKEAAKRTILELDKLRFDVFPAKYAAARKDDIKPLEHADVVSLVEWKLKHGTFRPGLLAMAQNNKAAQYAETSAAAFSTYRTLKHPSATKAAIKELSSIKGIGPATASLLLSMHDPDGSVFFSDEAFLWLCRGGIKTKGGIKYNAKEYEELDGKARDLMGRLGVHAREVEKVAFVLMRDDCGAIILGADKMAEESKKSGKREGDLAAEEQTEAQPEGDPATESARAKRKAVSPPEPRTGTRSSQRSKKAKS